MPLPASWTDVPVTGTFTYYPSGEPVAGGRIEVRSILAVIDEAGQAIPALTVITLDANGAVPAGTTLPSYDDTARGLAGVYYKISERFTGGRAPFYILIRHDDASVNLATEPQVVPGPDLVSVLGIPAVLAAQLAEDGAEASAMAAAASTTAAAASATAASASAASAASAATTAMAGQRTYTGGDGIPFKIEGSAFDPSCESRDFNISISDYPGVNGVGVRGNVVANIGWNMNAAGAREDPTDACFGLSFEQHYLQSGDFAFEFHLQGQTTDGVAFRPFGFFIPKDGAPKANVTFQVSRINFLHPTTGVELMGWSPGASSFDITSKIDVNVNGPAIRQRNADFSAYLNLPYYDANNALVMPGLIRAIGSAPAAGDYPGSMVVLQNNGTTTDRTILNVIGNGLAGSCWAAKMDGFISVDWQHSLRNTHSAATANAIMEIGVEGGSAGDAKIRFTISDGTTGWDVGVDNSDSDTFKWSRGTALGTNDQASLTTAGHFAVAGTIKTAVKTVATLGAAATVGAGARSFVTDATVTTFASVVAGGGANAVPVYSDGVAWRIG